MQWQDDELTLSFCSIGLIGFDWIDLIGLDWIGLD
jgi:hypothetical protein